MSETDPSSPSDAFGRVVCLFGALAVILGAFGAHALRDRFDTREMEWWKTGVLYHMVHTLAALWVARWVAEQRARAAVAGISFLIGILFFSGSLYLMALTGETKLGMVTPIGGLAFIVGWVLAATVGRPRDH
ncbi:MAG: DUF423 domain-containing protein [Planctomycetes bacterium]|nr:DUF423 domain-containing protein [Planctomycetota bacterium]